MGRHVVISNDGVWIYLFLLSFVQMFGQLQISLFQMFGQLQQTEELYGKHAAALYAQAADFNKTARFYYMKAQDAYYLANAQASYDDWRRARRQWDYFYRRK
eukprot:CAMPEP_0179487380 /NCGR_PEP_ID=MMETSP0799-20121207/63386_1 /TAXON_ID=46947 /ORGANISM="Geminigera cryophila, Strain CCMP2564" /LENGTH=101 /DNA_ID=CAMNT_0021302485 /DNA_START=533 /DNA_END=838 /DNA_ORIENTATION=+